MALKTTIQFRRDNLSAWTGINPTLAAGEIALVDLNNNIGLNGDNKWVIRVGNGVSAFNDLPETAYALSADVAAQISAVISAHEADIEALQTAINEGLSGNTTALEDAKAELLSGISAVEDALDAAKTEISAGIGLVKDELTGAISDVETKVDEKIKVGDATSVSAIDTLTIKRVSIEDYHNILTGEQIDDNTLYVVSSDNLNAFGSQIVQVGDATEDDHAVNLKQLNAVRDDLQGKIDSLSDIAGEGIDKLVSDVATLSATTIPALDGKIDGVAGVVNTLSGTTIPALEEEIGNLETSLSAYEISVTSSTDDTNRLKSWTFTQGGEEIAKVEVPFDVFVDKGEIVEHDGQTCLELTLKDGSVVHIPVTSLVDVYTPDNTKSSTIDVAIDEFKVSAEVRDGAITTAKLADASVTQAKLTGEFVFDCGGAE